MRILAAIGRFGPHLTIVKIFATQNNFKNGPGISDRLLGFYPILGHKYQNHTEKKFATEK